VCIIKSRRDLSTKTPRTLPQIEASTRHNISCFVQFAVACITLGALELFFKVTEFGWSKTPVTHIFEEFVDVVFELVDIVDVDKVVVPRPNLSLLDDIASELGAPHPFQGLQGVVVGAVRENVGAVVSMDKDCSGLAYDDFNAVSKAFFRTEGPSFLATI